MQIIKYKVNLRLNPTDRHDVICYAFIPYSEENMEYAKARSYDGEVILDEIPDAVIEPSAWDALDAAYREGVDSL